MMADVIPFRARAEPVAEAEGPRLSGPAFCGVCGLEWEAVAPVGVMVLECPGCLRLWGAFKNCIMPEHAWRCNCGEQLFWLTPAGAMCRRCGIVSNDWADG